LVRTGKEDITYPLELIFLKLTEKSENEMGEACSAYEEEEKSVRGFDGKT